MKRILLIEDEPGLQIALEDKFRSEGYEITIKGDGIRGEEEAGKGGYDIILLDLMLPGRDGFAVCHNLRKAGNFTPILILTARNTDLDTVMGLRGGADDYLSKPFDMGVLLARIEALLRRASRNPPPNQEEKKQIITFGGFILDLDMGRLFKAGKAVELHAQEYRLLKFLAEQPGKVLTRNRILDEVWGYGSETSTRTVDMHVARLRRQLDEADIPRHLHTVRGLGYRFEL